MIQIIDDLWQGLEHSNGEVLASFEDHRASSTRQFMPPPNSPMAFAEARRYARLRSASHILALVAGLVGLVVLVGGWTLDVSFKRSIVPGTANMKERGAGKRTDHSTVIDLDAIPDVGSQKGQELIALDDALNELAKVDPRKARVIELRWFFPFAHVKDG